MSRIITGAKVARLILSTSVLLGSLGLCSACAPTESETPQAHKCCSHKKDHKLPASPVQKECRNSRLDSSLAERSQADSVVMHSIHEVANSVPSTDFVLASSWDKPAASALPPIPDDPGSSYRVLLL